MSNEIEKKNLEELKVKKKKLGQFYSKNVDIRTAIQSLIKNNGNILEPSVGEGDLIIGIENKELTIIEIDSDKDSIRDVPLLNMDFFDYTDDNMFDTIIGNPPYVKFKFCNELLKNKLKKFNYNEKSNLYYFFIHKSINHLKPNGELIFITPKEFMYSVSAIELRKLIDNLGNITHFIDCGEEKLFSDASVPSLCIFRFEKSKNNTPTKFWENLKSYLNNDEPVLKNISMINDQFCFSRENFTTTLSDFFNVKVGVVSGMDKVYLTNDDADGVFIHKFRTNNGYKNYYYFDNIKSIDETPEKIRNHFLAYKIELKNRKIKNYNENDWWKYGAVRNLDLMLGNNKRIYVPPKTRIENPFFMGTPSELYSGALLGLFPKNDKINLEKSILFFNSDVFKKRLKEYFIMINNKFNFTPSVLGKIPLNLQEVC